MADIELVELVIKIPKRDYRCIKEIPLSSMFGFDNWKLIAQAIANGTPLPKGHGRLKDVDHYIKMQWEHPDYSLMDDEPTIIEADETGEE